MLTNWKSMGAAIDRILQPKSQIRSVEFALPKQIFGTMDLNGRPLKTVSASFFDINNRIADALRETRVSEFKHVPVEHQATLPNGDKVRIIKEFYTGDYFHEVTTMLQQEHGTHARALCFALGTDETTFNTTRTRSGSPLYLHILNAVGKSFRPILIGYLPSTHGLPYSDDILHKMLIRQGMSKITHRDYIITFLKRRMDLQYIEYVLRDLFELEATGFCARVGKKEHGDGPSEIMWFFPMISLFLGDTLQLDMLMGTNTRRKRRCRICRSDKCWKFYTHADSIDFRDHAASEELVRIAGAAKLAQILWPQLYGSTYKLSDREKEMLNQVHDECLTPGLNPLFQLPRWQYRRGLNTLSKMLPPDTLHTLLKGLLEHVVGWSLQIINQVSRMDNQFQ